MNILFGDEWISGFPEYAVLRSSRVLDVKLWVSLAPIKNTYFVPKKSLRLITNYVKEVGPFEVIKKINSRYKERYRNDKYISIGLGLDSECKTFAFIATCHPKAVSKIALDRKLTFQLQDFANAGTNMSLSRKLQSVFSKFGDSKKLTWIDFEGRVVCPTLLKLQSWSEYSGLEPYRQEDRPKLLRSIEEILVSLDYSKSKTFSSEFYVQTSLKKSRKKGLDKKTGVLFGYGQYAKTNIIPNVREKVEILRIHELDPTQIPNGDVNFNWSTDPSCNDVDSHDVHFIAGYHHTHADLAISALIANKVAVVEKPVVVNQCQLDRLLCTYSKSNGSLYSCFHKRYSKLNGLALQDLQIDKPGDEPVNYHCIVYEVALPELHWYNWPNSHSRVVSNGCHWIDHFLYLNGYPEVRTIEGNMTSDGTVNCTVECINRAVFTMTLTDIGSPRIGVQEHIELRHNKRTVRITNSSRYVAEDSDRVLRRCSVNKLAGHKTMYRSIVDDFDAKLLTDSLEQLRITHQTMITLEQKIFN